MSGLDPEATAWIDRYPKQRRSTEVFVPVLIGVGPVYGYSDGGRGGFYGFVEVNLPLDLEPIFECEHIHPSRDEAWSCAEDSVGQVIWASMQPPPSASQSPGSPVMQPGQQGNPAGATGGDE